MEGADWCRCRPRNAQIGGSERLILSTVCVCVCLDLSGCPTLPCLIRLLHGLEERCSQEGRATSVPLIFYRHEGFIGLINSLFMREEERARACNCVCCGDCVCGVGSVSGCVCEKGVYWSAAGAWWSTRWGMAHACRARRRPGSNTKGCVAGECRWGVPHTPASFKSSLVMNYKAPNLK